MSLTTSSIDYDAALALLLARVDYERAATTSYNERAYKLERMHDLLARLGHPQRQLAVVHITGTKGKGSTAAMLAAMLTAAGYRTGLFSSPHLHKIEERLTIDGQCCSSAELVALVERLRPVVERMDAEAAARGLPHAGPTYFELTTAMAWLHFVKQRVDLAVVEVGMGGRLDSTNVCSPIVSVVTNVSLDHTRQLGSTVEAIAVEKAGIIKPGVPVVCGVQGAPRAVVEQTARHWGSRLVELGADFDVRYHAPSDARQGAMPIIDFDYRVAGFETQIAGLELSLLGRHQAENAGLALAVVQELHRQDWPIAESAVRRGLAAVRWPARIEIVRRKPAVIVDAAHNVASAEALAATLDESFPARHRTLLLAATKDKDVPGMLRVLLPRFDRVVVTRYESNPRSVPVDELAAEVARQTERPCTIAADPASAWQVALQALQPDDLLCVTGSFFIAAEVRALALRDAATTG